MSAPLSRSEREGQTTGEALPRKGFSGRTARTARAIRRLGPDRGHSQAIDAGTRRAYACTVTVESGQLREWQEEFDAASRRPLPLRIRYAFIRTYKPILDDALYRSFDSTAQYRAWCEENLPAWLGYGRGV